MNTQLEAETIKLKTLDEGEFEGEFEAVVALDVSKLTTPVR